MSKHNLKKLYQKISKFPSISRKIPELNTQLDQFISRVVAKLLSTHKTSSHKGKKILGITLPTTFEYIVVGVVCGMLLFAIAVTSIDLQKNALEKETKVSERDHITKELEYWKGIIAKHPDYRDAYFRVAILSYRLGNREDAWKNLQITLQLDPNYEPARELEDILKK